MNLTRTIAALSAAASLGIAAPAAAAPGSLDTSFDEDGFASTNFPTDRSDEANGVAVQDDGKVVVVGHSDSALAIARYKKNGSLDPKFGKGGLVRKDISAPGPGPGGELNDVAVLPSGKIVVVGESHVTNDSLADEVVVARFLANGKPDKKFSGDGFKTFGFDSGLDRAFGLATSGGKIVVAGDTNQPSTSFDFMVARLTGKGKLDKGFGDGGAIVMPVGAGSSNDSALDAVVTDDGSVVAAGDSDQGATGTDTTLVKFTSEGELDAEFDGDSGTGNGIVTTPIATSANFDEARAVANGVDGRLVIAGRADASFTNHNLAVARYLSDGTLDDGFSSDGIEVTPAAPSNQNDEASAAVSFADGSVIAGGEADLDSSGSVNNGETLVRYTNAGALDATFDGNTGTGNGIVYSDFGPTSALDRINDLAVSGSKLVGAGTVDLVGDGSHRDFFASRYVLTP